MSNAWLKHLLGQRREKWDLDSCLESQTITKLRSKDYITKNDSMIHKVANFMDPMHAIHPNHAQRSLKLISSMQEVKTLELYDLQWSKSSARRWGRNWIEKRMLHKHLLPLQCVKYHQISSSRSPKMAKDLKQVGIRVFRRLESEGGYDVKP